MRKLGGLLSLVAVFVLVACEAVEPPDAVHKLSVNPGAAGAAMEAGGLITELRVTATLANGGSAPLPVDVSWWWYQTSSGVLVFSGRGELNTSSCGSLELAPGVSTTCTLYFHYADGLLPSEWSVGRLGYTYGPWVGGRPTNFTL